MVTHLIDLMPNILSLLKEFRMRNTPSTQWDLNPDPFYLLYNALPIKLLHATLINLLKTLFTWSNTI